MESFQVESWSGVEETVDSSRVDSGRVVKWSGVGWSGVELSGALWSPVDSRF